MPKFKYEDLQLARKLFDKGEWFFTFHIKSGFHHINIAPEYQKYLGFQWTVDGVDLDIVNFPDFSGNIPIAPAYGTYISQLVRYSQNCRNYDNFSS